MPGGNPTIKHEPLDLGSFLARKRKPLDIWLIQNNITSEQTLQRFLNNPEWSVSEKLIETIRGFFVVDVKIEEQPNILIQKSKTLPPPPLPVEPIEKENQQEMATISSLKEMVSITEEEEENAESRSATSNRERKKHR